MTDYISESGVLRAGMREEAAVEGSEGVPGSYEGAA